MKQREQVLERRDINVARKTSYDLIDMILLSDKFKNINSNSIHKLHHLLNDDVYTLYRDYIEIPFKTLTWLHTNVYKFPKGYSTIIYKAVTIPKFNLIEYELGYVRLCYNGE